MNLGMDGKRQSARVLALTTLFYYRFLLSHLKTHGMVP